MKTFWIIGLLLFAVSNFYAQDGALDVSFGIDGKVTTAIGSSIDDGNSVAIQSDGKIVVADRANIASFNDFALVRYNSDGTLDNSFGSGEKVITGVGTSDDFGYSVAIQSDGKIIVGGSSKNGSYEDFAVVRYNANGSVDTGFGTDGKVTTGIGSTRDYGRAIAIQSDGKIVVAGISNNGSNNDFAVIRLNNPSLPVELTSFTAQLNLDNVVLNWRTATEVNNYGFEIERASSLPAGQAGTTTPVQGWGTIGFVQGHGNSNSPKSYKFVDANPPAGSLKYRLKQIDTDGKYEYYGTIAEINFNPTGTEEPATAGLPTEYALLQNYPNPFNPETIISYQLPEFCRVQLTIYDVLGREIALLVDDYKAPGIYKVVFNEQQTINHKPLTSGVYFYSLTTGNFAQTKKLIFMK